MLKYIWWLGAMGTHTYDFILESIIKEQGIDKNPLIRVSQYSNCYRSSTLHLTGFGLVRLGYSASVDRHIDGPVEPPLQVPA